MRQGQQHRRGRGRHNNNSNNNNNHRKGQNPLTRSFESNGPDVKVRGNPAHIAEKYISLARDAQSSGDPVLAENYLQHAEHYNRIILAYREQNMPQGGEGVNGNPHSRFRSGADPIDGEEFGEDEGGSAVEDFGQTEQPTVTRFPNEPMAQGEGGPGARHSEQAPQQQGGSYGGQPRENRQHRHEHGRFRDRYDRNDRNDRQQYQDRQGGGDREHRQDRQDRYGQDRQDRYQDRHQRYGDRRERYQGNNPQYQQQPYQQQPERANEQPMMPERPLEARQPAPMQPPTEAVIQPMAPPPPPVRERQPEESAPTPEGAAPVQSTPREAGHSSSRRRERFGTPGNDQPEFLKRSVRRPKRDPEASAAPEAPAAGSEPPQE